LISAVSSVSDAWSMHRFGVPAAFVSPILILGGIKLAASAAYAWRLKYASAGFLVAFALFSAFDLQFLVDLPPDSLLRIPEWGLRLFTGLAFVLAVVELVWSRSRQDAQRHAA
jgi:hypothetical protein